MQKQFERLQEKSIINEIFRINLDQEVATIGGLKLGCTKKITDSWDEINAALG